MSKQKILIVEDDENIRELMAYNLAKENYTIVEALTGEEGLEKAKSERPELILLDLMLPEIGGLDVCRAIKSDEHCKDIPVIMVTAKGEESDVVTGLELGADDYVTKPFRPRELVARIRSVLRRFKGQDEPSSEMINLHGIEIHPGKREVKCKGETVGLTFTEYQILSLLAQKPGWVFSRYDIVDSVKGQDYPVTDRSVDVQIAGLRKKLGEIGSCIETIRGFGYRMKEEN